MTSKTSFALPTAFLFTIITITSTAIGAGTPFFDDFEDGSVTDGSPVSWGISAPPFQDGLREVINGDYVLTPDPDEPIFLPAGYYVENDSEVVGWTATDFSLRTTVRALGDQNDSIAYLYGRDTWDGQNGSVVWMAMRRDGRIAVGAHSDYVNIHYNERSTDLDIFDEDVNLRFDVEGRRASAYAWRVGDPLPARPLLTMTIREDLVVEGAFGVGNGQFGADRSGVADPIAFRHFEFVPEPSGGLLSMLSLTAVVVFGRRRRKF